MTPASGVYDVIVVGGGPSALAEALHLRSTKLRVIVLSEQFGGCMDILGDLTLQSYVPELEIANAPLRLTAFMRSRIESHPTGEEYAGYVRACFSALPIERRRCTVRSVHKEKGLFIVAVEASGTSSPNVLRARQVVLATGVRPKTPDRPLTGAVTLSCFEAYRHLTGNDLACFAGREVCIVGSGNTAFQLAYSLARTARCVTVLANKYVGVYPIESADRFALRARSLLALELIEKTAASVLFAGPMNDANSALAPIYLYIYEGLDIDQQSGILCARISPRKMGGSVVAHSLEAALRHGHVTPAADGTCIWARRLPEITTISAIGVEANRIESPWKDLIDGADGFIQHVNGRTSVPGLYATGCAAGYPSVNLMRPVFGAVLDEGRPECSL